jgi:hypothetical protein
MLRNFTHGRGRDPKLENGCDDRREGDVEVEDPEDVRTQLPEDEPDRDEAQREDESLTDDVEDDVLRKCGQRTRLLLTRRKNPPGQCVTLRRL